VGAAKNLIAHIGGNGSKLPICFTGHTDVVAPRNGSLERFPLCGRDRGWQDLRSRQYRHEGRRCPPLSPPPWKLAPRLAGTPGIVLVITAAEESGCEGANFLLREGVLPKAGAMVVAEPTSNQVLAGHKGVCWLEGTAKGVTAHGSMPEKGVNAVYKAARAALSLEAFDFSADEHSVLGRPTINVGWLRGGLKHQLGARRGAARRGRAPCSRRQSRASCEALAEATGGDISFEMIATSNAVWTDPSDPWIEEGRGYRAIDSGKRASHRWC